jgi:hypothetical protein
MGRLRHSLSDPEMGGRARGEPGGELNSESAARLQLQLRG